MEIEYIDRKSGQKCIEKVYGHKALSLLYGDGCFRRLFSILFLPLLARIPYFSRLYGYLQKQPASAKKIAPFIHAYGIDATEFERRDFASFNDFFIRKLKPERRPIAAQANVLAMPADGRYLVYPQFDQFAVKGQRFSLTAFLQGAAGAFQEGAMAIVRLCPTDYHRFHFPCDGVAGPAKLINGPLFSVNPMALRKRIAILSENKRMVTEIETERFGTILYVEIGATSVGSIHQTYTPGVVKKGEEKGYFEFGGSCIVLLFEKGRIVFDADLVANSKKGLETRANFGESLGCAHGS
ncbi:MAG TPA: archaetidylserine decarboxylase [Chlamydiales bacterium]|nr:archaetidylserine decarboxylase [Chlamydiales bacterium]